LHVLHLLHSLLQPAVATAHKDTKPKDQTHLDDLLMGALGHIKRRSLVFVVSDFISTPGWEKPLGQLAQKHEVIAVRLVDPAEQALPDIGMVTLEDPETGEQLLVDMHDKKFRTRYEELAAQNEADIFTSFAKAGVDALELSTVEALINTIVRFAQMRKQRAYGAVGSVQPLKEAA
jgi:uncharacterized protein (DUF58 family)